MENLSVQVISESGAPNGKALRRQARRRIKLRQSLYTVYATGRAVE
ncbi:hypothetical protein GRI97_00855 [Altererythrobacter xixiisoli]|uniref:Uncharacterized protein n=1 Tax=Croceibacterium xixiisoli TaxID=1476466 RepID=A0A6I4TP18_9SPHN|nr:hypothetical protein [Croceibacterium xixiisoli]MXO97536.1 hypothetical protein [Croceibacterium xixiisoli]